MEVTELINNDQFVKKIQDKLVKKLFKIMKPPDFDGGRVPVYIAAKALATNPQAIREQMKANELPIGSVLRKDDGTYEYHIVPKKLYEWCGYIHEPALRKEEK